VNDYDTLEELFNQLENLDPNSPRYAILSGKVYDTARYGDHHIPLEDINQVATDLNRGDIDSAQNLVSQYLEPETTLAEVASE